MELIIEQLSKKYPKNRLFDNLNYKFVSNNVYAITGENGSGKSTLMKIIAGVTPPTHGEVTFLEAGVKINKDNLHKMIGISAPYLSLIEEFTLQEHLDFHSKFKEVLDDINLLEEIESAKLLPSLNKNISEFSSGMQQRLKLILCCCFQSQLILLDEPCSHLDSNGKKWYTQLLSKTKKDRLVLIASNEPSEYNDFTEKIIYIGN